MNKDRWQRIKDLVYAAVELTADGRKEYLDQACNGDATLRDEVENLIAASHRAGAFLDQPALPRPEPEDLTGSTVGPYRLAEEIGRGGMGIVYRAVREDEFRQEAAIKIIKRGMDTDNLLARFRHERQILALLNHPNIARIFDGGTIADGRPYFVMELVVGRVITAYCDEKSLGTEERLRLFLKVCAAVAHAHRNLVIHRDLKPANILITSEGEPKLLDFGIAKVFTPEGTGETADLTAAQVRLLTPEYASPEQVRGETITTASDVYSLGAVLYELLTGVKAHRLANTSPTELERAVCLSDPPKPSETASGKRMLRGDLDNIILKALQKQPERRYSHVEQFADDVARYLEGRPILARPDSLGYRATKFVHRHKAVTIAAGLLALSSMVGTGATLWEAHIARIERGRAERRFNDVRALANSFLFEVHDAIQDLPGSTPARKLIVDRALRYLDTLAKEAKGDRSLQSELAAAYEKVGEVQGGFLTANLGDEAGAIASYRKALNIREAVAALDPANREALRELMRAHGKLSDALLGAGDRAGSLQQTEQLVAIAERLAAADPTNSAYRLNLAMVRMDYGWKTAGMGGGQAGLEALRKALPVLESADPGDKRMRRVLAIAYSRTGELLSEYAHIHPESLAMHNKARGVLGSLLAKDPQNTDLRSLEAWQVIRTGDELSHQGDLAGALANYTEALKRYRVMSAADVSNVQFHLNVAMALNRRGGAQLEARHAKAAVADLRDSLSEVASFSRPDSPNTDVVGITALDRFQMGKAYAVLACEANLSIGMRADTWRQAQLWYQRSLPTLLEAQKRGSLLIDGSMVDEAQKQIAPCGQDTKRLR